MMTRYTHKELVGIARDAVKQHAKREGFRAKYTGFTLIIDSVCPGSQNVCLQANGVKVSEGQIHYRVPSAFVTNIAI